MDRATTLASSGVYESMRQYSSLPNKSPTDITKRRVKFEKTIAMRVIPKRQQRALRSQKIVADSEVHSRFFNRQINQDDFTPNSMQKIANRFDFNGSSDSVLDLNIIGTFSSSMLDVTNQEQPIEWKRDQSTNLSILSNLSVEESFNHVSRAPSRIEDVICISRKLRNINNSCYVNSLLQAISVLPLLKLKLLIVIEKSTEPFVWQLANILLHLSPNYQYSNANFVQTKPIPVEKLVQFRETLGDLNPAFSDSTQQDPHELLFAMVAKLDDVMVRSTDKSESPSKCFHFFTHKRSTCSSCSSEHLLQSDQHIDLQIAPIDGISIQELVDRTLQPTFTTCSGCAATNCSITTYIEEFNCILLTLKRYLFDETFQASKSSVAVKASNTLILKSSTSSRLELCAVISHQGNVTSSGHYVSFVKDEFTGQWYKCDDNFIQLVNYEHVERATLCTGYLFFYKPAR